MRRYSVYHTLNIVFRMEVARVQRVEGVTVRIGLHAISTSSVSRDNRRSCTNESRYYPVGAGEIQGIRADGETVVAWLSARNDNEQERRRCPA